jgi:hypothetical protein
VCVCVCVAANSDGMAGEVLLHVLCSFVSGKGLLVRQRQDFPGIERALCPREPSLVSEWSWCLQEVVTLIKAHAADVVGWGCTLHMPEQGVPTG